jgi:hypothetical protein
MMDDDEDRVDASTGEMRQERGAARRIHGGSLVMIRRAGPSRSCMLGVSVVRRGPVAVGATPTVRASVARRSMEPVDELDDDDVAVLHAASVGRLRLPAAHDGVRSSATGDSRAMMRKKVRRDASFQATATEVGVFASLVVHLPVPHLARWVLVLEHRTSEVMGETDLRGG